MPLLRSREPGLLVPCDQAQCRRGVAPVARRMETEEPTIDLLTLLRILVRRWYVVLPTLAITVLGMTGLARSSEPVYEVSGSMILLVPNQANAAGDVARNPYLDLSGSLVTTAQAVADLLNGPTVRRELVADGHEATYEVVPADRLPTLSFRTSSPAPDGAVATAQALVRKAGERLQRLQDAVGAPADQRIAPTILREPSTPVSSSGRVNRGLAAVGVLGALASLSLALIAENLASRTRRPPTQPTTMASPTKPTGNATEAPPGWNGREPAPTPAGPAAPPPSPR